MYLHKISHLLLGSAMLFAQNSWAETIVAASGTGAQHPYSEKQFPAIAKKMSDITDGSWTIRNTNNSLVKYMEMKNALRDDVVQIGKIPMSYFPSDYPASLLPADVATMQIDPYVVAAATTEYLTACLQCQQEFAANKQVYLGNDALPPFHILARKKVDSLDDLSGLRVRTAGPSSAAVIKHLGGNTVNLSIDETFTALNQGIIDATHGGIYNLQSRRLIDITTHVYEISSGLLGTSIMASTSLWQRLSLADRHALVRSAQFGIAAGIKAIIDEDSESKGAGIAAGIKFSKPDTATLAKIEEYKLEHKDKVIEKLKSKGVLNVDAEVQRFDELLVKWSQLLKSPKTEEEYANLLYNEIWAHVDFATYGISKNSEKN